MAELITLLLDMDGPLANFDALYFERCALNGWTLGCEVHEQRHRFAHSHLIDETHREPARAMVNSPGWFADLPVTEGAVEGLTELAEHAEIWICSKPLDTNPTCRDEKASWLTRHFGEEWARRLIIAPDKSLIRGDVLLDDAPYLEWFERAQWRTVIFPTPWNGDGSKWAGHQRWTWGNPAKALLEGERP